MWKYSGIRMNWPAITTILGLVVVVALLFSQRPSVSRITHLAVGPAHRPEASGESSGLGLQAPLSPVPGKFVLPKLSRTGYSRCTDALNCVECPTDYLPNTLLRSPGLFAENGPKRPKAVITILCRNKDLLGVINSLSSFEKLINSRLRYPYVLLNNEPFSEEFKRRVTGYLELYRPNPEIKFSLIPKEHWDYPSHINQTLATEIRNRTKNEYIYGGLESYRFMIRYFSGPFFHHPDMLEYDYYWRVEPDVDFFCRMDYDPFALMQEKNIKYGFNIMIPELMKTVPTLYSTVLSFQEKSGVKPGPLMSLFETQGCGGGHVGSGVCYDGSCCSIHGWCGTTPEFCDKENCARNCRYSDPTSKPIEEEFRLRMSLMNATAKNALGFCGDGILGNGTCIDSSHCCSKWGFCGKGMDYCNDLACVNNCVPETTDVYNGNHFWSNFEIADFRFFRGKKYTDYFNHLDKAGGFFYERWGDAPVHSLAVGLFLEPREVHYFGDIGYRHAELTLCPLSKPGCGLECYCNTTQQWGSNSIAAWAQFGGSAVDKLTKR